MLKLLWFVIYALRFERAIKTDNWDAVARCFHDDARYIVVGGPPFAGETIGRDRIAAMFQDMLANFDRRFDRRAPKLLTFPKVTKGVVVFRWRVHYFLGDDRFVLEGESSCEFRGRKIWRLRDDIEPEACTQAASWLPKLGGKPPPWGVGG